jgi:hypothetical protein
MLFLGPACLLPVVTVAGDAHSNPTVLHYSCRTSAARLQHTFWMPFQTITPAACCAAAAGGGPEAADRGDAALCYL